MNFERLFKILAETTILLQKECEAVQALRLNHGEGLKFVDCYYFLAVVDELLAESYREEFVCLLKNYPNPKNLRKGPNYHEVGRVLGGEETALQFFALGKVLGLWRVVTPLEMGVKGPAADELARSGWIYISGYYSSMAA